MAGENIKVNVDITSNGTTDRETKKANALKAAYDAAAKSAQGIAIGGTAGSRAIAATAEPVGAQLQQRNIERGVAGQTGASARDFANQAQGLGGLVRLYATYAANVFAVGAAFRALSTAMDTTNMVRGLDQIGAASGVALGGLSKQLVAATGGAISLREAMSATVKVTAAGLGSENVLRLGQVAAKASQALGVDMTDAISRLSRGITKLEPELLDELGIFTKIDPAVEKYALRVGKAAGQLTDFERRQAFANAVLEEGEKKFAAIQVDANPYNKLAASLTDIAQKGLELVNTVLTPIINLLSSSPTALITALVGVGGAIIRQAVPAFGLFRENIKQANLEALQAAKERAESAVRIRTDLNEKLKQLAQVGAENELAAFEKADAEFKKFASSTAKASGPGSAAINRIRSAESAFAISDKDIATAEKAAIELRKKGLSDLADQYDNLTSKAKTWKAEETKALGTLSSLDEQYKKDIANKRTIAGLNASIAQSAEKASFKNQIVSNAAYNASLIGPINAIKLMRAELALADIALNKFDTTLVISRGVLAAFAGAAATVGTVLLNAFGIITTVIGIGALLASLFTNTAKESQATSEAFGQLEESTKNLGNTIDGINKKPYLEQFTAETINARANALEGFAAALEKTNRAAEQELSAMNILDRSVDIVKMIWGGDVQSKLNEETARGIANAFKDAQMASSESGKAAKELIAGLLKVNPDQLTSFKEVQQALDILSRTEAADTIRQINAEFVTLGRVSREQATNLLGIDEAAKKLAESRQKFTQGLIPTDNFATFGRSLLQLAFELDKGLENPETRLQTIRRLFEELKTVGVVSPDALVALQDLDSKVKDLQLLNSALANTRNNTEELTKSQQDLEEKLARILKKFGEGNLAEQTRKEIQDIKDQLAGLQKYEETTLGIKLNLETTVTKSQELINDSLAKVFATGGEIVASKLSAEFAKAGQTISNALSGLLTGTEAGIRMRANAEKAMLDVQLRQIKAQEAQIRATAENTIALNKATILQNEAKLKTAPMSQIDPIMLEIATLKKNIASLEQALAPGATVSKLTAQRVQDTREGRDSTITAESLKLAESLEASRAAIANIAAQSYAVQLKFEEDLLKFAQKRGVENQQRDIQSLKATRDLLVANQAVFDNANETGIVYRQNLDTQIRQSEEALRQSNLLNQQEALEFARKKVSESNIADKKEQLALIDKELNYLKQVAQISSVTAQERERTQLVKDRLERIEAAARNQTELLDRSSRAAQADLAVQAQKLTAEEKSFDILSKAIRLSPEYIAAEEQVLAKKRAQLEFDRQRQQLQDTRTRALQEQATAEERVLAQTPAEDDFIGIAAQLEQLVKIRQRREEINKTFNSGIQLQQSVLDLAIKEADSRRAIADEQNRYNKILELTANIGSSIRGIFEGLGAAADKFAQGIESTLTSFAEVAIQSEKNAKSVKVLTDALSNSEITSEERTKVEKELGVAKQKQVKDELAGNIKIIAGTKSMFKEKTGAYKVLSAIEKAMHLAKLAMDVKELASKLGLISAETAAEGAGLAARMPAIITGIYGKITSQLGTFGPAVATAIIAAIGLSAWSRGGGGGGTPAITAQQRQETQGSAMAYNTTGSSMYMIQNGQQREVRPGEQYQFTRGKLGDPTAKSTLLEDSMKLLTEVNVDNLDINNKQLEALRKIEAGIRGVVAGIYNIPGLSSGSLFGTTEGGSGSSLFGLFGKSTSKQIIDSGLQFSGSLQQLADNAQGLTKVFETVQTTSTRKILGFSRTRTSVSTETDELSTLGSQGNRLGKFLTKTFDGAIDFLRETASAVGLGEAVADVIAKDLPKELATFSTRGIKPEELGQAFQAWLGSVIDFYGVQVFQDKFDDFAQGGEELTQTVARVVRQNEIVNQSFRNLGLESFTDQIKKLPENINISAVDLTVSTARITQELIDLAGGIDTFAERANNIAQNFLTEAERRTATEQRLNQELAKIGLPQDLIKSRRDYVDFFGTLQQQVAQGIPGAAKLLNDFMALEGLYNQVLPEISDEIGSLIDDIKNNVEDIQKQILRLSRPGYQTGNAFWNLVDSLDDMYQKLVDADQVTRENVKAIVSLTNAQLNLLMAQNQRKTEEQLAAFELEATTKKLNGFSQIVANIATKAANLVRAMVDMNTATQENIDRVKASSRAMYDAAVAENQLSAEQVLLGISAQAAELGMSQLGKEINGITKSIISAAQQLAEIGQLTDSAISQLLASAEAQINFAQQQNATQAQNILSGFALETQNQGLSQFAQQIQGVRDKARGAVEQLAQLGQATEENIGAIAQLAQQQIDLIAVQNQKQAQDIILAKNTELITKNLGQLGQELLTIAQQAQDAARQLVELGQATGENIAAIRAWQAAMVQSARTARLSAQEEQYAQVFAGNATEALVAKFRRLGFTMPSNLRQFQQLIDAIDTTTIAGIDLRGQLLDLGSEFTGLIDQTSSALRSAYEARVSELTDARNRFKDFAETLKEFKTSLLTGQLSPLTPQQQYQISRQEFLDVSGRARSGDVKAIEKLQGASNSFLESSRAMFASSELYAQDFSLVTDALDNTVTFAEMQIKIAENTLSEIKSVVGNLISLNDAAENSDIILTGVGSDLEKAIADYTTILNSSTIDISRWEATSANIRNGLLDASLFVQQQIDSGIDSVLAGTIAVDTSIGDVATNIKNMETNSVKAIGELKTELDKIKNNQTNEDFSQITQAIDSAAKDPQSSTKLAIEALQQRITDIRNLAILREEQRRNELNDQHNQINRVLEQIQVNTARPPAPPPATVPSAPEPVVYYYYTPLAGEGPGDFAVGTNYVPEDMLANIHEGERIIPAADNAKLIQMLEQPQPQSFSAEIEKLNRSIKELQETVAQGAVLNANATNRNTEAITTTISDTKTERQYMRKIQDRTSIV